ncbi:MAG: tetratricopeptide repeat protein [Actinobacteria bacterium]|nr:tetratricopeptide repeat protein [Actinomycetota bacterium]
MKKFPVFLLPILILLLSNVLFAQEGVFQEEQDFRFAKQLEKKGMNDIAALQFMRFAGLYPTSLKAPEALFSAAMNYEKADSSFKASDIYLRLLLRYPQSGFVDQAQFNRAKILSKYGDHLKAALAFDRIKLVSPQSDLVPAAQIEAAREFVLAGQNQRAMDAARFLLEEYPTHPLRFEAHYLIAEIRGKQSKIKLALQELDRIVGERIEDDLAVKALLLRADLLDISGRHSESDSILLAIVGSGLKSDSVGVAAIKVAKSLQKEGDYDGSDKVIQVALKLDLQEEQKSQLQMIYGDNFYAVGNYEKAMESYANIARKELSPAMITKLEFRLGFLNEKLGKKETALNHFQNVISTRDSTGELNRMQHDALFAAVDLLNASARSTDALVLLRMHLHDQKNQFKDEILFRIGKTHELLKNYDAARQTFATILTMYPQSKLVDDAQLEMARCADLAGNYSTALTAYRQFLRDYPGADGYQEALRRQDFINKFFPARPQSVDAAFNDILSKNMSGLPRAEILMQWAEQQINTFHDYANALLFLKQAIVADGKESLDKGHLLYLMSYCHSMLAEKFALEHESTKSTAHLDTAKITISLLDDNFAATQWPALAAYRALDIQLTLLESPITRIVLIDSLIKKYAWEGALDSLHKNLQFRLATELLSADRDSVNWQLLDRASRLTDIVLQSKEKNKTYSDALYLKALVSKRIAKPDTAAILLTEFLKEFPNSQKVVDATFQLAGIKEELGDLAAAARLYSQIIDRYFYSSYVSRAVNNLGRVLLRQGKIEEAKRVIEKNIGPGFDSSDDIFFHTKKNDKALWLWTQAVVREGNISASMQALKNYLLYSQGGHYRDYAMLDLGDLAVKMHKNEMALGYFKEVAKTSRDDSLAQFAKIKVADFYFDQGRFKDALNSYSLLKKDLTGELRKKAILREIICNYKLGAATRAVNLTKKFKKEFSDDDAEAKILYEQGMYFIAQKNFKSAKKAFKTIVNKYHETPEGGRGELGLARLYVILNKTDDALKTLTAIPGKYSDPEIQATAYLNLGDFYYENRQVENSIFACKKVLDLQQSGPLRAKALNLLINSYDDFRLWDRAIALEREYIKLYPDAKDIMARKIRIGVFLFDLKEYDRTIVYLRELKPLVDADSEPEVQYWIAKAYADRGDTEKAIIEYLKIKYLSKRTKLPWGATALYEAGRAYKKLGNLTKAKEMFQQVVRERGANDQIGRVANQQIQEIDEKLKNS